MLAEDNAVNQRLAVALLEKHGHSVVVANNGREAIDALEKDEVIQTALGREYARTYIQAKRDEWEEYHNAISQWEIDRYVDLY